MQMLGGESKIIMLLYDGDDFECIKKDRLSFTHYQGISVFYNYCSRVTFYYIVTWCKLMELFMEFIACITEVTDIGRVRSIRCILTSFKSYENHLILRGFMVTNSQFLNQSDKHGMIDSSWAMSSFDVEGIVISKKPLSSSL